MSDHLHIVDRLPGGSWGCPVCHARGETPVFAKEPSTTKAKRKKSEAKP